MAAEAGADVLFAPEPDEIYPAGFQTWVDVEELSRGLEGAYRPGHFRGVATVCLKLFNIVRPQFAYFGQKDAQQIAVIRRMVLDLNLDLTVRSIPTVRDPDGLAISSRNVLLSAAERAAALALPRALSTRDPCRRPRRSSTGSTSTTSRSPTSTHPFSPPQCASARPDLIDNVILNEEER